MRSTAASLLLAGAFAACQGAPIASPTPTVAPPRPEPTMLVVSPDPMPAPTAKGAPTGRLAFQRTGPEGGIFLIDADGSNEQRILHGTYGTPRWSPDGKQLAVYEETADHVRVAILNADGTALHLLAIQSGLDCGLAAWAPSGRQLALECWSEANQGATGIYLVGIDGAGTWQRLTRGHGLPSEFSADGKRLLFARDPDGNHLELAEVDVEGTNERTIGHLSIGQMPGYFGGVGEFYVVAGGAIVILNPSGSVGRSIAAPEPKIVEARLSPDGRDFAFIYDPRAAASPGLFRIAVDGSGFGEIAHADMDGIQEEHPDWAP
jgi:dipeptidyl aminopeptidase/acylaminoacyl peptidase